jgi:hypothetical protein
MHFFEENEKGSFGLDRTMRIDRLPFCTQGFRSDDQDKTDDQACRGQQQAEHTAKDETE